MKNGGKRLGIRFLAFLLPGLPLLALGPDPFERLFEEPRPGYAVPGLPLPKGYGNYRFGMKRAAIVDEIARDPALVARDADFFEGFELEDQTVLTAEGRVPLDNAWFVFDRNDELYCIVLRFDRRKLSYQELQRGLQRKYGRSAVLGLDTTVWQDAATRLQLEEDLHLKYIDLARFARAKTNFSPGLRDDLADRYGIFKGL